MTSFSLWERTKLPPEITGKLNEIIRRVRLIQLVRGVVATLGVAIAAALVVMAVDAAVAIYSDGVRLAISLAGLALVLLTAYIALVRPLADRITPVRMARIIETRHPELQERISSALELLMLGGGDAEAGSRQLLNMLVTDARTDVSALSAQREFKGATMKPVALAAGVFAAVLLLLFAVKPRQTALLLSRAVAPCAKFNNLAARTFSVKPGDIVVVEGESALFSLTAPGEDSSRAELCIERKGEPLSVERMLKRFDLEGGAPVFELSMPRIDASFTYRMRIGKALTRKYTVTAVPPPAHSELVCVLSRPDYTGLGTTQLVSMAEMPLKAPAGTKAQLETRLNRSLHSLLLLGNRRSISPEGSQPADSATFAWTFSTNSASQWALALRDDRGFTNVLSWASYEVVPDYPADIRLTYPSGSSYTLPTYGHLKTVFELRDDYGIGSVNLVMQPDNDKIPWTTEVPFEKTGKNTWQVTREISLGEFMIGGARKIRIWLEATDNLPQYLGGPNITKSRVIAVNLDNAERRSLADQVRVPERNSITNMLEQAAQRLEEAARKLAAATNSPSASDFEAAIDAAETATREAAEKADEAHATADDGLFAGVSKQIQDLAEESVDEALGSVEELPLTDEEERAKALQDAIETMNKAAEEARAIVPEVLEKDAILEKASALESLAAQEAEQARKAKERQLTDAELDAWEAKQKDLVNKFGAMDETSAPAPEDARKPLPDANAAQNPPAQAPQESAQPQEAQPQGDQAQNGQNQNTPSQNAQAPTAQNQNAQDPNAPETQGEQAREARPQDGQPGENDAVSPVKAAEAAVRAAQEAKAQEKDEKLLQQARTAEAAAKESRRAATESQRAKTALEAVERDREALEKIAQAAEAAKSEAKEIADDAFQVKLEAVKREAEQVPPDVAKAAELAKKAAELAEAAEKLAAGAQGAPSPEKLEALANELANEAKELGDSKNPFLKQAAEMAAKVADAALETAWGEKDEEDKDGEGDSPDGESASADKRDGQREGRHDGQADAQKPGEKGKNAPGDAPKDNAQSAGESGAENGKSADPAEKSPIEKAAEALSKAAENAAKPSREQAADAIAEADAAAHAATNLAARLDAALHPADNPPATQDGQNAGETGAQTPPSQNGGEKAAAQDTPAAEQQGQAPSPFEESPLTKQRNALDEIRKEAEALAEDAREAAKDAAAAEQLARAKGANLAANAAQKARQTAETAEKAANATREAAEKAEEALAAHQAEHAPDGDAQTLQEGAKSQEFKPPAEVANKAAEAARLAGEAAKRSTENASGADKLSASPAEHAARAAEAAKRAAELSKALADAQAGKTPGENAGKQAAGEEHGKNGSDTPAAGEKKPRLPGEEAPTDEGDESGKVADISQMTPDEIRKELAQATAEARREAQAATETAADTRENLPVDAARAAQQAADRADAAGRAFDAANATPQPGQPAPNKEQFANQAESSAEQAGQAADKAERLAKRAEESPREQVGDLAATRRDNNARLDEIAKGIAEAAKAIQAASPIAATNAAAAETVAGAKRSLEESLKDAAKAGAQIQEMIGELPAVTANADRVAKQEREAVRQWHPEDDAQEATPSEVAAKDARELSKALDEERKFASDLETAARQGASNPKGALDIAERIQDALEKRQDANPSATEAAQGNAPEAQPPAEAGRWQDDLENAEGLLGKATRETQDLARKLEDADELMSDARDAFDLGDAAQAQEVANEALKAIDDVSRRAAGSEAARRESAEKAMANSKASSEKAQKSAQGLLSESASAKKSAEAAGVESDAYRAAAEKSDSLSGIASNVVAAAELSQDSPEEARKLADKALQDAMALQAPSKEQLEAARQANLASQEFKRLAAQTAELAGLDPETMKVKKPEDYKGQEEKKKDPNRKKKPARTEIEGGGGEKDPEANDEEAEEYEDGLSLEMPEWLRRLGFPISEWLKYKGSLESGLPDSALEHVPQEYRELVREYFKLLSTEK